MWPLLYKKKTVAYGVALYAFLSIVELYIAVPQQKSAQTGRTSGKNLHSRGCSSTDGKIHVEVSFIIVKHYHDVLYRKSIYICFLGQISCLSDVTCPSPYLYVPGDVSGPGTLDYETHSMDNMTFEQRYDVQPVK